MRVLVVEDDPVLAEGLLHILQQSKYAVTHERNGKRADSLLAVQEFDW